ncbi:MAG: hypothetical protein IKD01_05640 [Oscillospiraceae bacterium]|nr:hypothetical protein [Oscillospiraceae bacterium]
MTDYQKMYAVLFSAITDALLRLEEQNFGMTKTILQQAQLRTEEMYINSFDDGECVERRSQ